MNIKEVKALRRTFNSVKERQQQNIPSDFAERKKRLKNTRELCIGNEELLDEAIYNLKKNGIKVHFAKEKQDAIDIIIDEIGQEKLIVKSKSNVTKEIGLTRTLEEKGIEVVETDIGDRILQLLDTTPSHPTGPVAHLSAVEIAKRLSFHYNKQVREDPDEIVKTVREDIIRNLERARVGITGANAVTIEEGSIILTHNEGNIYEVMKKEKHIVVTSIDKIYPDIESVINMLKILSFNATGSLIPSFVEIITGVSKTADVEKKFIKGVHGPSEIVLVLLDNKRSEIIKQGSGEILYCVGCGNCLIHCPVYNTIGNRYAEDNFLGGRGLAYDSIYNNEKNDKLKLCLSCGKCRENCPVDLDIPRVIRNIRSEGISQEIYYFLKSHMIWIYFQALLRLKDE